MFRLRFPKADVRKWAGRYEYRGEEALLHEVVPPARRRGFLERSEFLKICAWKTPRSKPRCAKNNSAYVKAVTKIALDPKSPDRLKIQVLTLLSGVGWPTASVILHLCDRASYPILDYRALWSVSVEVPSDYTYELWRDYTRFTRSVSKSIGCSMRTLDRALWQYSKERQPSG